MKSLLLIALAFLTACSRSAPPSAQADADRRRMQEKASEDYRRHTYQPAPVVNYEP